MDDWHYEDRFPQWPNINVERTEDGTFIAKTCYKEDISSEAATVKAATSNVVNLVHHMIDKETMKEWKP
jgi:hypothetical protein